jgi:hypothetical protein
MEQLTIFTSSRGLLKSCPSHNSNPHSSQSHIDSDILRVHRSGDAIYVCTDAVYLFARDIFPHIKQHFVLVSGDSDVPVNEALLTDPSIAHMLADERLHSWYAQNLCATHAKLIAMPIGLDYHTMSERPGLWGMTAISPIAQEHALLGTLASSPEFNQRYLAAYCNWHFAMGRGDRQQCFDRVDKSVCFFEPTSVPRQSTWTRQAECMFVVSPEGAGVDCHRTWEALMLGCIPIVKRNAISTLFEQLPVLLLDDWAELTKNTLVSYFQALAARKFDFSTLFREHWCRRISGAEINLLKPMSHTEFRLLLTRRTG